jgi:hypothetical protein
MPFNVFLSHSNADKPAVEELARSYAIDLAEKLGAHGFFHCFLDYPGSLPQSLSAHLSGLIATALTPSS